MKRLKQLIFLMLIMGCDDKLELENPNLQTATTYWQTEQQALDALNAAYGGLIIDGTYMRMYPALNDGRGDDITGDSPWGDLVQVGNFTIPSVSGPVDWVWSAHYQLVYRANQVIHNVDNIKFQDEDAQGVSALRDRIKGQAYFLRGLTYFNLANFYKQVPLITELPVDESKYYPETASEEDLWTQIFEDFQAAKAMLPNSYQDVNGLDQGQVGRARKGAAAGMLGKAYLYRGQWQKAADEFAAIINGTYGNFSLMPNYRANFSPLPQDENNAESLFEVQFATLGEVGGTDINWGGDPNSNWRQVSAQAVTYAADGKGFSDFLPTTGIYAAFKEEMTVDGGVDPRLLATIASYEPEAGSTTIYGDPWYTKELRDPVTGDVVKGPDGKPVLVPNADLKFPRKYTNEGFGYVNEYEINSGINYRVLRYADILLMYAEALNELGRTQEAYPYIQQVRSRANLPELAVVKPNLSQEQMRDQIGHERFLEFAIEGQRIYDIIRWGWLYMPDKLAMLKQHDNDFNTWTPGNEYLPIPQRELDINKNLTPNSAN